MSIIRPRYAGLHAYNSLPTYPTFSQLPTLLQPPNNMIPSSFNSNNSYYGITNFNPRQGPFAQEAPCGGGPTCASPCHSPQQRRTPPCCPCGSRALSPAGGHLCNPCNLVRAAALLGRHYNQPCDCANCDMHSCADWERDREWERERQRERELDTEDLRMADDDLIARR